MIYALLWVALAVQLAIAAAVGADRLRRRLARWADGRRRVRAWNRIRLEQALLAAATPAPARTPAADDRPGTDQDALDACMAILRATPDHRTEDTL